jgi:aspartyl/asparaginyl-tRNA synthetase
MALRVLTVLLVTPSLLSPLVTEAANRSLPVQNLQTWKGFVAAKAERSMTVLDGSSTIQVMVTQKTEVAGQRNSFAGIAVDDVVRVEGSMTADRHLQANHIEVLLAADGMGMAQRARTGTVNRLLSVILNHGITVPIR